MLYKLGFTITILLVNIGLLAQDFSGGILAGLAASEISGDRLQGPNKAGLYFGGFVNRYFSPRSSIQMELDYIQKGSRENPDSSNNYYYYRLRLNYIEIPVHYRYDFSERGTLETGLSLGVLVHQDEEGHSGAVLSGLSFDLFDLSANIGIFYTLLKDLRINIRYSNSLLPIRPHAGGTTWRGNRGQYNEVLSFVLFYEL